MTLSVLLKRKKKLSGLKKRRSNWSSFKSKTTSYGIITLLSYRNRNLRDLNFKKLCEILRTEARMMQKKKKNKKKKQWRSLKPIFYRELKREEDTKVRGTLTDTACFSQWRYFRAMFIKRSDDVDPAVTTIPLQLLMKKETRDQQRQQRPINREKWTK